MKKSVMMLFGWAMLMTFNSTQGMKLKIEQNLLRTLFFRPELITTIKPFLSNVISTENMPKVSQKPMFTQYLKENGINLRGDVKIDSTYKQSDAVISLETVGRLSRSPEAYFATSPTTGDKNVSRQCLKLPERSFILFSFIPRISFPKKSFYGFLTSFHHQYSG